MTGRQTVIHWSPSRVPDWLTCAQRASYEETQPAAETHGIPVRKAVGLAVHARITKSAYTLPPFIVWDQATRAKAEMHRQIDFMANQAQVALGEAGLTIIDAEERLSMAFDVGSVTIVVRGRYDLHCRHTSGRDVLLEVKTGLRPPARVWAQASLNALLFQQKEIADYDVGVLWIQRPHGAKLPADPILVLEPAKELFDPALAYIKMRVYWEKAGPPPMPSAIACKDCPVSGCVVRAVERPKK